MRSQFEELLNGRELNINAAFQLIHSGCDVDTQNSAGETLLHRLVSCVDRTGKLTDDAKKLITRITSYDHADPNKVNRAGKTPLECYLQRSSVWPEDVAFLIRCGTNPHLGKTLFLHLAVLTPSNIVHRQIIRELVNEGKLNIEHRDSSGKTALECLLDRNNWSANDALFLVECGANPQSTNSQKVPLLHLLVTRSQANGEISIDDKQAITQLIEKHRLPPNSKDQQGRTVLQALLNKVNWLPADALFLVELGADPNVLSANGLSLFHHLVLSPNNVDDEHTIQLQLAILVDKHGVDPNMKNAQGQSALQCYLDRSNWQTLIAMYLVCLGADPYTCDSKGQPLIHKLITPSSKNSLSLARVAITHLVRTFNVNPMSQNAQGLTPIEYLIQRNICSPSDIDFMNQLKSGYPIELSVIKRQQESSSQPCASSSNSSSIEASKSSAVSKRVRQLAAEEIDQIMQPLKNYAQKTSFGFHYHTHLKGTQALIKLIECTKRLPVIQIRLEFLLGLFEVLGNDFNKVTAGMTPEAIEFCQWIKKNYKNKEESGFYKALKASLSIANQLQRFQNLQQESHSVLDRL